MKINLKTNRCHAEVNSQPTVLHKYEKIKWGKSVAWIEFDLCI